MPSDLNALAHSVIGAGFSFPAAVNMQGSVQLSSDTPNLEESIRIILGTKLGERVYRPNFGCRLSELVFEPMNSHTMTLIRLYVEEALEQWEPRITLRQVITEPEGKIGQKGLVHIHILYSPKDEVATRSMVYPFYLEEIER